MRIQCIQSFHLEGKTPIIKGEVFRRNMNQGDISRDSEETFWLSDRPSLTPDQEFCFSVVCLHKFFKMIK